MQRSLQKRYGLVVWSFNHSSIGPGYFVSRIIIIISEWFVNVISRNTIFHLSYQTTRDVTSVRYFAIIVHVLVRVQHFVAHRYQRLVAYAKSNLDLPKDAGQVVLADPFQVGIPKSHPWVINVEGTVVAPS
jgi:hypothetical protein